MTKKTLAWFGAAFLAVSLAACGGGSKPAETTPPTEQPGASPDAGAMAPEGTATGNPCSTGTGTPTTGNPCTAPK